MIQFLFLIPLAAVLFTTDASASARLSDGKTRFQVKENKIYCHVEKGFHFNKEAPASLQTADGQVQAAPSRKEEIEIVFDTDKVSQKLDKKTFTLNFYVCDDAKTVCEPQEQAFVKAGEKIVMAQASAPSTPSTLAARLPVAAAAKKSAMAKRNEHGFILNDYQAALELARREKKLVLVDFGAPWCPACIRLETETFGQAEFKKATQKLIKLSMNADLAQNKALADKYAVKGIPTLLLLDADGNEIHRILDFKPAATLAKELNQVLSNPVVTYDSRRLEAEAGNKKAMAALGLQAFNALDYATALKWLAPLKDNQLLFANAEVAYWAEKAESDPSSKREYRNTLEKWITLFPNTYEAIVWRIDYAHQWSEADKPLPGGAKTLLETNIQQLNKILASRSATKKLFAKTYQGELAGFEKIELNAELAETFSLLNDKEKMESAKAEVVKAVHKMKLDVSRPGELITALHYLNKAGLKSEVISWNEKLMQAYPHTYVYYMRSARFYMAEKEFAKALPLATKAVELGPEVVLQNMQVVAKIQAAMNQKEEAKKTIVKALALPEAKLEIYKRQAAALQELQKTL